ncbi:unnamed protein product, partial [Ectocarpus sp. 12 AP-2014]
LAHRFTASIQVYRTQRQTDKQAEVMERQQKQGDGRRDGHSGVLDTSR